MTADLDTLPISHRPELAEVVEEGFVEEVRDGHSGKVYISSEFLRQEVRELNLLRGEQEDKLRAVDPRFRCAHCGVGVTLRRSPQGRWHFRHQHEDGSCRYQTKGVFSQDEFDARRYNGQKEGPAHKRMKSLIHDSLHADRLIDPHSILEEVRWKGKINPATWRIPDLQAMRNDIRIAFEVQLSSTYVNVMRERRHFYLTESGLLFWILTNISKESRRQFQDDVLFPNNCNMFAIDEETRDQSLTASELVLRCGYFEPIQEGWRLLERWHEKVVPVSTLTMDTAGQRAFYFDYDSTRRRIENEVRTIGGFNVIEEFRILVAENFTGDELKGKWLALKKKLPQDLKWPLECTGGNFLTAVRLYLSAREGAGVGWDYRLIQVAHACVDRYPYLLPIFEDAMRAFGRNDLTDKRYAAKWVRKKEEMFAWRPDEPAKMQLMRLRHYRAAMEWLMPEIRGGIASVFAHVPPADGQP